MKTVLVISVMMTWMVTVGDVKEILNARHLFWGKRSIFIFTASRRIPK